MPKNRLQASSLGRLFRTNQNEELEARDYTCRDHVLQKKRLVQSLSSGEEGDEVSEVAVQLSCVQLQTEDTDCSQPKPDIVSGKSASNGTASPAVPKEKDIKKESSFTFSNVRSFFNAGYKQVSGDNERCPLKNGKSRKYPMFSTSPRSGRYSKITMLCAESDESEDEENESGLLSSVQLK